MNIEKTNNSFLLLMTLDYINEYQMKVIPIEDAFTRKNIYYFYDRVVE